MAVQPPNQTEIVNTALARLGSTEVLTSIETAPSNSARRVRGYWDNQRRVLLAQHPWNCAIKRETLNADATAPLYQWKRRFALPPDCLRWLPGQAGDRDYFEAEREGGYLLSNAAGPLLIRYIFDNTSVPTWSPALVEAMIQCTAEFLAEPVTQSASKQDAMYERAQRAIRLAKRLDGLETGQVRRTGMVARSSWVNARRTGWFGPRG